VLGQMVDEASAVSRGMGRSSNPLAYVCT